MNTDKASRYFKNKEGENKYYKVYDNGSWQHFLMPEETDNNNNVILQWTNGGINFESRVEDAGWEVEEVTEIQIKAAIFTIAL